VAYNRQGMTNSNGTFLEIVLLSPHPNPGSPRPQMQSMDWGYVCDSAALPGWTDLSTSLSGNICLESMSHLGHCPLRPKMAECSLLHTCFLFYSAPFQVFMSLGI
jgi:hypothetical protein